MPAKSKQQQKFFGMVRACQKGKLDNPSPEVEKAASQMPKKVVKDFASTKHKGLPNKVKSAKNECTQKRVTLTEEQLNYIMEHASLLNEVKTLVDNFNEIANYIDKRNGPNPDPDQFYYIEVKKRFKDNPGIAKTGNYDGYGIYLGSFRVHSGQELLSLKQQIVTLCDNNNARAYITQNPRSENSVSSFAKTPKGQSLMNGRNSRANLEDIISGQAKSPYDKTGKMVTNRQGMINNFGSDRSGFMFDIDEKDPRIYELTEIVLNHFGINIIAKKKTPSGGMHIICDDAFAKDLPHAVELLRVFDAGINKYTNKKDFFLNKGRQQTVHASFDGKFILYSNVNTPGY